jgi:hypothetical protein
LDKVDSSHANDHKRRVHLSFRRGVYRTKAGNRNASNDEFDGQSFLYLRDSKGDIVERTVSLLPSQDLAERDFYGPFGLEKSISYASGKASFVDIVSYDRQGSVIEDITLDGDTKPIDCTLYRRKPDGSWTQRTTWRRGLLHSQESYDSELDLQRYEEYDESGAVKVTFIHRHGRIEAYWSASREPDGGTTTSSVLDDGGTHEWHCSDAKRICTGMIRHSVSRDPDKSNPVITTLVADDGNLIARAFYEYEFDDHHNWTGRKVWVQLGEQGERLLYETDTRKIAYLPN